MLKLENVSKSYGAIKALEDISFDAKAGSCVCVVGRSGCGKSTLLKLIALIAKPTQGIITIDGKAVNTLREAELERFREKKVAYSFQEPLLIPYMTTLENLTDVVGVSKEKAADILSQLGLSERLNHRSLKLSGGEKKRVDLARAILRDAPLLVTDEPLSSLDPSASLKVIELLKAQAQRGKVVIYSAVEPLDAKLADSIVQM